MDIFLNQPIQFYSNNAPNQQNYVRYNTQLIHGS